MDEILDILLDSVLDSLKIFIFVFIANVIIGLFENKISKVLSKSKKVSPLIGSAVALIPQCGISVVSTDLFIDGHISIGTIISIYIATSDEALPMLLSNEDGLLAFFALLIIKFVVAVIVGFLVDLILKNRLENVHRHLEGECHHDEIHKGCCNHDVEDESKFHRYFLHPLFHSLRTLLYVFIVTLCFGLLIYFVGENNINSFLSNNKYLAPLFSVLIGFIPNCASSVLITNLYLLGGINFGSLVSGLIVNSGLGLMILIKNKEKKKDLLLIMSVLLATSLIVGYLITILGF